MTINTGGSLAYFAAQPDGTYLDPAGEYGTLTRTAGVYTLTDLSGDQEVFLANGFVNYAQDTDGNRITLDYTASNLPKTVTYSNPADSSEPTEELSLSYNAQGFVSQETNGTGETWMYAYDAAGHLLSVTAPDNLITTYGYSTSTNPQTENALVSITNPTARRLTTHYDTQGRLTSVSGNSGAQAVTYAYPGQAEVVATDAAGDQTTVWP